MADKPVLLSGGNPQIPKGYGQAPIDAYIAAMPGWKSPVGRHIDDIVSETVPGVMKAVKWNSPMYGTEQDRYFLSLHCFEKYIKIAFHKGASLNPEPPVSSKQKDVRYYHVFEDGFDAAQFADWVKQASGLPGEKMRVIGAEYPAYVACIAAPLIRPPLCSGHLLPQGEKGNSVDVTASSPPLPLRERGRG